MKHEYGEENVIMKHEYGEENEKLIMGGSTLKDN